MIRSSASIEYNLNHLLSIPADFVSLALVLMNSFQMTADRLAIDWELDKIQVLDPIVQCKKPAITLQNLILTILHAQKDGLKPTEHPWPFHPPYDLGLADTHNRVDLKLCQHRNTFVLDASSDLYLLHILNTASLTQPCLSLLLISEQRNSAVITVPFSDRPHFWKRLTLKQRLQERVPFHWSRLSERKELYNMLREPSQCLISTFINYHFGHYVVNDLGPAVALYQHIESIPSFFKLARVDCGYLTPDSENFVLSGRHDDNELINFFSSPSSLDSYVEQHDLSVLSLWGCHVEPTLSINLTRLLLSRESQLVDDLDRNLTGKLRSRIVIGIGVRGGTREALNLDEVVDAIIAMYQRHEYADICLVIDGLAANPADEEPSPTRKLAIEKEHLVAKRISDRVGALGVKTLSVIGQSLEWQLYCLMHCQVIIGHIGSSSAKYLCMLNRPQLIHSPSGMPPRTSLKDPWLRGINLYFGVSFRGVEHAVELYTPRSFVIDTQDSIGGPARDNYRLDPGLMAAMFHGFYSGLQGSSTL